MFKEVALMAALLPSPVFADEEIPVKAYDCGMFSGPRSCTVLYVDLKDQSKQLCVAHATGYFKGIMDFGDEQFYSLLPNVSWNTLMILYYVWVEEHPKFANEHGAGVCIIRAMHEHFPLKEVKDDTPESEATPDVE